MPEIKEHIAYLSQEIGARPAGTEEEQQAALYITEQFQKDAGLPASIEDFNGVGDADLPAMICCGAAVVFALLSLIVPVLSIVGVIGSLAAAALFAAELFGRPVLSKFLGKGVSQNVVAKYEPGVPEGESSARRRKVILVARYDTGKVRPELASPVASFMPLINKVSFGALVALPVLLLIKGVALSQAEGALPAVFTVLVVVAMVLAAIPLVFGVLHKTAAYNEGANNNASGVAALLEVAHRIGVGRVSEAEIAEREDAIMHGEEAAYDNGLVPEGAEFVYAGHPHSSMPEEESLVAAKAAIAALSGKPVSGLSAEDVERNLEKIERHDREEAEEEARMQRMEARAVESARRDAERARAEEQAAAERAAAEAALAAQVADEQPAEAAPEQVAAPEQTEQTPVQAEIPEPVQEPVRPTNSVPDWFVKAQEKAKKPRTAEKPVQRSRYASALDAAVAESAGHFAKANNIVEHELERAIDVDRDTIHEVKAPQWATIKPVQPLEASAADSASQPVQPSPFAIIDPVQPAPLASIEPVQPAVAPVETKPVVVEQGAGASDVELTNADQVQEKPELQAVPETAASEQVAAEPQPSQIADAAEDKSVSAPRAVSADPFATVATPPIDVTQLHIDDVPPVSDIPMPAFLDPRKVQAEAQQRQSDAPRSDNRLDATNAAISENGRVDSSAMVKKTAEQPEALPGELQATPLNIPTVSEEQVHAPITLPDIGATAPGMAPVAAAAKQRAPLADVESKGKKAARSLLSLLPSIGSADVASSQAQESQDDGQKADHPSLLASLPSLSGAIKAADVAQAQPGMDAAQASLGTAGATGSFAPVSAQLVQSMDPEDMYVHDADDSAYEDNFTETGAFAGPGYMEMPKSRFRRFLDKFHRNKGEEEDTPQDWLDVDEEFEARAVGKARGGWESFQEEHYEHGEYQGDYAVDEQVAYEGSTQMMPPLQPESQLDATQAFVPQPIDVQPESQQSEYGFNDDFDADDVAEDANDGRHFRPWHGGAFSSRRVENANLTSEELADEAAAAASPAPVEVDEELSEVYQFRNPDINTEVWFVALGSELAQNAGMRAFLEAHELELRGAFIIDLDALGAGDLTMIEREGYLKPAKASSRMKRYIRKASQASGVKIANGSMMWEESAASFAAKHGQQAMHLVGMDGAKPALYGQVDDTIENIDDRKLNDNVQFLMELLKNM